MPQVADTSGERILILTPDQDRGETCRRMLLRANFTAQILRSESELIQEISNPTGAILVSTESLTAAGIQKIGEILKQQQNWSSIPILVFVQSDEILSELEPLGPMIVLQEPVHVGALVAAARAALAHRQRQYQVRDLLAQLAFSNRAKSDFLANVSHEIRTPLGAVLGFSELLMENGVTDREKQVYSTAIRRNGQLLSALIDDILDLAKVEAGRIEFEKIEFSLSEMMAELVSGYEPQAEKKGLRLITSKAANAPDLLKSDPVRLKQVFNNILNNAIKFTSHGAVSIHIGSCESAQGKPLVKIEIEDTGIGISAKQAQKLFQPFSQADSSTTRRYGGTGLGLFLSRRLLQALGGDLTLKWSIPGGGSCFQITIAAETGEAQLPHEVDSVHKDIADGAQLLGGAKVLVVDDSLDNQMLIGRILSLLGAYVDVANDGIEGVERALNHKYDVILMDLQMPRMGGVEATRVLREKGCEMPIVALTAHALKEDRVRCLSVGCTDYLTKPIQRSHLVQVLEKSLSR